MKEQRKLDFSIIIPVYNRPDELEELMESFVMQTNQGFEVVIVEDGSDLKCDDVVEKFKDRLDIKYFYKENTGPGQSRNYGYERAKGNYCLFFDSDCILPPNYIEIVKKSLAEEYVDAYGGPDKEHEDFSNLQKAINYSMTSFFTTGGIRGGGEKLGKFYPRSFNMGFSREVYDKTGGFPHLRFAKAKAAGEDMDLSIQIIKLGYRTKLIKEAFVYHKRRTSLRQFFHQVYNFGYARITISQRHPKSLKIVHFFPSVFSLGVFGLILLSIFYCPVFLLPLAFHLILLFVDSTMKNRSLRIGLLSMLTSYIQLLGYGYGFGRAFLERIILGKKGF